MRVRIQAECQYCHEWVDVTSDMVVETHYAPLGEDYGSYVNGKWVSEWRYHDAVCSGSGDPVSLTLVQTIAELKG